MPSPPQTSCSYQYQPLSDTEPDDSVPLPSTERSRCPHPAARGDDERCLFHSADREFPPDAISDAVIEAIESTDRSATFAGGRLGPLDLSDRVLETPDGTPIDLRGATIDGTLDLSGTTVAVPLLLGNAAITGSLEATDARFEAPINIAGANVGRRVHLHDAHFEDGIAANGLDVGFVDARGLTVTGPAIFDDASFEANTRFSRATFDGPASFDRASWRLLADFASITATEPVSFATIDVGGELRFNGAALEGGLDLSEASVSDEASARHAVVDGELTVEAATFKDGVDFEDLRYTGPEATLAGTSFKGKTTLSLAEIRAPLDCSNTEFLDEVWFTHGQFEGPVTFSGARSSDFVHLRDAHFGDNLFLADVAFDHQSFLHGSTIDGTVDATGATFDHFQFSATVTGDADFSDVRFDGQGIFRNSEFGGQARFDDASFAGGPDFTDCRFKREASFEGTEFLVEPTFEDARFAVDPDLEAASYPQSSSRNLSDRRRNMIVARPEELLNGGLTIPIEAIIEDIVVPAAATEFLNIPPDRAAVATVALQELEQSEWYDRFDRSVELARTAVSELDLEDGNRAGLVFGLSLTLDADDPAGVIDTAMLVGAYRIDDNNDEITFSHLDPDLEAVDHLVSVSAGDEAFESGASVGTHGEFRTAIFRRQALQTRLLDQDLSRPHNWRAASDPGCYRSPVSQRVSMGSLRSRAPNRQLTVIPRQTRLEWNIVARHGRQSE